MNKIQQNYMATITKQELAILPSESCCGVIKVIDKAEDIEEAVNTLRASDILGFDTETRPSFKRGQTYKVSLLQLSTRTHCFLFRLNKIGFPDSLKEILEDPELLKIGLSVHDDFHSLGKLGELVPKGFIDLQNYVKSFKIADNSLSRIYALIFGKRISKGQRLTNWEADNLSDAQQAYAALDALACVNIYETLENGDFIAEASPYYRDITPHDLEGTSDESVTANP